MAEGDLLGAAARRGPAADARPLATDGASVARPDFRPRFPWLTGDLQTIRNLVTRSRSELSAHPGEELWFPMADGTGDMLHAALSKPARPAPGRPLALLIHGMTGCYDSTYVRATAAMLLAAGYPVLRLNLRGAGPTEGRCAEQYHAGRTEDLRAVLAQLPDRLPEGLSGRSLVAVGYSLGGNMLLKYLGEEGAAPLDAAVSVSAPIDLAQTSRHFHRRRNWLYVRHLLRDLKAQVARSRGGVPPGYAEAVRRARTVRDYDEVYVAPRYGFASALDYYARCSGAAFLDRVRVPTLLVHARDDPWIGGAAYDAVDWARNRALTPAISDRGGHVGFHGAGSRVPWHDRLIAGFLGEDR